jgi:hypothetical protein
LLIVSLCNVWELFKDDRLNGLGHFTVFLLGGWVAPDVEIMEPASKISVHVKTCGNQALRKENSGNFGSHAKVEGSPIGSEADSSYHFDQPRPSSLELLILSRD